MDMRERMARALQAEARKFTAPVSAYVERERLLRWEEANDGKDYYIDGPGYTEDMALESWAILADAVLAVLREPDAAALDGLRVPSIWDSDGDVVGFSIVDPDFAKRVWQAMIDHISKPGEPAGDG